jgi:hypothetical protein
MCPSLQTKSVAFTRLTEGQLGSSVCNRKHWGVSNITNLGAGCSVVKKVHEFFLNQ